MSSQRHEADLIREWLDETYATERDPGEFLDRVIDAVPTTPQRRLRWWHRVRPSRALTPTAADTTGYQPSPIPATNGHAPIVIRRTKTMFSPAKAITAGALIFAVGSAFLIAQPFDRQGSVPGAETVDVAPTWVTGDITLGSAGSCSGPDIEADGDVIRKWNYVCGPQAWTSSDPRLAGEAASVWNDDEYRMDDGSLKVVNMSALFVRNYGGGWTCSSPNLLGGGGLFPAGLTGGGATYTCVGDDGYAGLSAVLVLDGAKGYSREFTGLIIPGDLPPLPERPAAE